LTLKGATKVTDFKKTWCKHEIEIAQPKDCFATVDDLNKESPPMTALCLSMKTTRSQFNTNEIAAISCIVHYQINQDGVTSNESNDI
jgi:hypothetical protein